MTAKRPPDPNCELRAIRIYSGRDRWGETEDWPDEFEPLRFEGFLGRGDLSLYFGRVPSLVRGQLDERDAFLSAVLQVGFGLAEKSAEEIISTFESERRYEEPWYVTLVFDQPTALPEVSASEESDTGRIWWDWVAAEPAFDRFAEEARQVLDAATVHLGSLITPGCLDRRIDQKNLIVILREGKKLSTIPKITGSANASLVKAVSNFPTDAIQERFGRLGASVWSDHRWLDRPIQWYSLSLLAEDRRREFQTVWLALEILVNKAARRYRSEILEGLKVGDADGDTVVELLSSEERSSLVQRFAVMALKLSPETADEDLAEFRLAKKGRDAITHGVHDDPDQLPIAEARILCRRYIDLALADLVD